MDRFTFKMIRPTILLTAILTIGCSERTDKKTEITLDKAEIEGLLKEWKRDSLGCLRTRDPEKMKIYAKQLVGKDSLELMRQLGRPNHRYGEKHKRHFYYTLECPKNRPSYYNFYFHFTKDTIESFSNPVLN
jgi:hypothetical protein